MEKTEEKKKLELTDDELANVSDGKIDVENERVPLSEEEKQGQGSGDNQPIIQ